MLGGAKPGARVCPDGFARQLTYGASGVIYRDLPVCRSTAATQFTPVGKRYESKHSVHDPERPPPLNSRPRWTQERIDALPLKSGMLTRTGKTIEASRQGPMIRVSCSGGTVRCKHSYLTLANVYESADRPQSCMPCSYERKRKASAFTQKGYAAARDFAAKQRENEPSAKGVAA
jgi:hypothetical protein